MQARLSEKLSARLDVQLLEHMLDVVGTSYTLTLNVALGGKTGARLDQVFEAGGEPCCWCAVDDVVIQR